MPSIEDIRRDLLDGAGDSIVLHGVQVREPSWQAYRRFVELSKQAEIAGGAQSPEGLDLAIKAQTMILIACCYHPETGARAFTEDDAEKIAASHHMKKIKELVAATLKLAADLPVIAEKKSSPTDSSNSPVALVKASG